MYSKIINAAIAFMVLAAAFFAHAPYAHAANQVNFAEVDTKVRGAMQHGAQLQCVNKAYTPVADAKGNLRMIAWGLGENSLFEPPETGSDYVAGKVQEVAVAKLQGCNFMVTASRGDNNAIKLISWFASADGFDRLSDTGDHGMMGTEVAITSLGHPNHANPSAGIVVVATRGFAGKLILSSWSVGPGGAFAFKDLEIDEVGSEIEIVAIEMHESDIGNGTYIARVVTAMKTAEGNLKLIAWNVDVFGSLHRLGDSGNQAGSVQDIAMARYAPNRVVTAVKNSTGKLQMIAWNLDAENTIQRLNGMDDPVFHNPFGPNVTEVAVTANDLNVLGFFDVVTAVRTSAGKLLLTSWGIDTSGNIVQLGDSGNMAGAATQISIGWSAESDKLVTSMRDSDGNLRVKAWRAFKTYAQAPVPTETETDTETETETEKKTETGQVVYLPLVTR